MKILILFLFIHLPAMAKLLKETRQDSQTIKEYDLNGDKKVDYIEIWDGDRLAEKKDDRNFDGVFDVLTTFPKNDEFEKIVEYFKPRRRLSYWRDEVKKLSFLLTQIDEDGDGKWERSFTSHSSLNHERSSCEIEAFAGTANIAESFALINHASQYTSTPSGYKVHSSCLSKNKDWFLKNLELSLKTGMACLDRLGADGGRGALTNKVSLENLLHTSKVQLICHESSFNWRKNTIARATAFESDSNEILKHPGISLNPEFSTLVTQGGDGAIEFQRTIFHEQLHNLGLRHGHDIEYPYNCEKCCFPKIGDYSVATELACKVCSGNYSSQLDLEYIKDVTQLAALDFDRTQSFTASLNYVKANPEDKTGLAYLALNMGGVLNPLGSRLSSKLLQDSNLSSEQRTLLYQAGAHRFNPTFYLYDQTADRVTEAYHALYVKGDAKGALSLLKENIEVIKKELGPERQGEEGFVKSNIQNATRKLILDVWLNGNMGHKQSREIQAEMSTLSHHLLTELGL
jgi:hypothetical protein